MEACRLGSWTCSSVASWSCLRMGRKQPSGSRPFEKNPEMLLAIGELARMFGRLPHEILELDPYELGLAMMVYQERDKASTKLMESMSRQGLPVFPVAVLKG